MSQVRIVTNVVAMIIGAHVGPQGRGSVGRFC